MTEQAATEPVVDLAHLRRMTGSNAALEREVLSLFYAHSALLMQRLRDSGPEGVPALAHTLKGSALAVGANAVTRAVDVLQELPSDKAALASLDRALAETRSAVAAILARVSE